MGLNTALRLIIRIENDRCNWRVIVGNHRNRYTERFAFCRILGIWRPGRIKMQRSYIGEAIACTLCQKCFFIYLITPLYQQRLGQGWPLVSSKSGKPPSSRLVVIICWRNVGNLLALKPDWPVHGMYALQNFVKMKNTRIVFWLIVIGNVEFKNIFHEFSTNKQYSNILKTSMTHKPRSVCKR